MNSLSWMIDMCETLKSQYVFCDSMMSDYKELTGKEYWGRRVGFHFCNKGQRKAKTLSRSDFYQVFNELAEWLEKHQEINATLEVQINKKYAFVDVALIKQPTKEAMK